MPTNQAEQLSATYLEQLLQRSVLDAALRKELETNAESFGIPSNTKLVLPTAVEIQEQSNIELTDDVAGMLGVVAQQCQTSCTTGPYTIVCDGSTK